MGLPRTCAARRLRQNINNGEKLVTRLSIFLRKWNFEVLRNVTFSCSNFLTFNINRNGDVMGKKDDAIDNTGNPLMTSFVST